MKPNFAAPPLHTSYSHLSPVSQCQSLQCQKYINCLGLIENQNLIKELKLLTNIQSSFFTNYLDKAGLKYNYI